MTKLNNLAKGILSLLFIAVILFSSSGCKKFGVPDWQLDVNIEQGIGGSPSAGVYKYEELTVIEYNYYPLDSQYPIEVLVNGSRWALAGEFTIYANLKVEVRFFDIRGGWKVTFTETSTSEKTEFTITFSGTDMIVGTFTDDRGYYGTWEIEDGILTITYSNWLDYILLGTATSMGGTWTGNSTSGTWSSYRVE